MGTQNICFCGAVRYPFLTGVMGMTELKLTLGMKFSESSVTSFKLSLKSTK